jgi:hypothetical protein
MLHEITYELWIAAEARAERGTLTLDADGGDDAASRAQVEISTLYPGVACKIISIAPAGAAQVVEAAVEGAEAPADDDTTDTTDQPRKRR